MHFSRNYKKNINELQFRPHCFSLLNNRTNLEITTIYWNKKASIMIVA